jgi:hypothetical protein
MGKGMEQSSKGEKLMKRIFVLFLTLVMVFATTICFGQPKGELVTCQGAEFHHGHELCRPGF